MRWTKLLLACAILTILAGSPNCLRHNLHAHVHWAVIFEWLASWRRLWLVLVVYFLLWAFACDVSIFVVEETFERVFEGLVKEGRDLALVKTFDLRFLFSFAFLEVLIVNWGVSCEGRRIRIKLELVLACQELLRQWWCYVRAHCLLEQAVASVGAWCLIENVEPRRPVFLIWHGNLLLLQRLIIAFYLAWIIVNICIEVQTLESCGPRPLQLRRLISLITALGL